MNEAWGIALLTALVSVFLAVFGTIATCLYGIYKSILKLNETFMKVISREECTEYMDDHCDRIKSVDSKIEKLRETVNENKDALNKVDGRVKSIEDRVKIWHEN